ncbi:hypothetical protein ABZ605_28275 [Streptomyces sp. NPDC012765]|uniref:hypothetical protein n=1 Tax=Streptomyces sp. NPDC012765 TaxID=3155249 RepID=UPI003404585D
MTFTPEQTFAALYQAIKPEPATDRYDRGYAWAMDSVRRILAAHRLHGSAEHNLATVEPVIQAWLDEGPDYDSKDYNQGCAAGQHTIMQILDGNHDEVLSQLEDAARDSTRLFAAAKEA